MSHGIGRIKGSDAAAGRVLTGVCITVHGHGSLAVASNGCSAASLAMVATYLTGREYLPDEIARYFGDSAENNIARLEKGSEAMKLPFRKAANWHETEAALEAGKAEIRSFLI